MAEKKVFTLGLSKIEMGDIAQDGGMGTTLAQLGYTYKDSCTLTQEDPETNDFYAEEVDDPVVSISKAGKSTINFQLMNPSPEVLVTLMGGTASASVQAGDNDIWEAPDTLPEIEQSVRITPSQGYQLDIPRAKVVAKIIGDFKKTALMLIDVTLTVMQPTKTSTAKIKAIQL